MLLAAGGGGSGAAGTATPFGFDVPTGDAGSLESAASAARRLAHSFRDQAAAVRAGAGVALAGWSGPAASAFSEFSGRFVAALNANAGACDAAAQALGQLAQALTHAQTITRQALADCERYRSEMITQQGNAQTAGREAQNALDQAAAAVHPATVQALTHQAQLAQAAQHAATTAATQAEHDLTAAERQGRQAWDAYVQEAQALSARIDGAAGQLRPVPVPAGGAPIPVPISAADSAVAARIAMLWAAGCLRGNPVDAIPASERTPGAVLALAERMQSLESHAAGSPASKSRGGSVSLSPAIGVPFLLAGFGASAVGGSRTGVSGLASFAGRTLRTGETAAERSMAARLLPEAGGLARDLKPFARGAGVAGIVLNVASDAAQHESVGQTVANTVGSTVGATAAGGFVGGVCEGGTLGLGTPGCIVLGGLAAGAGGAVGGWVTDQVYKPVSHLIDSLLP